MVLKLSDKIQVVIVHQDQLAHYQRRAHQDSEYRRVRDRPSWIRVFLLNPRQLLVELRVLFPETLNQDHVLDYGVDEHYSTH
ncbi:uncharacterized [Tachysurus ichikawai]